MFKYMLKCCGGYYKTPTYVISECPICLEDNTKLVSLAQCGHAFCESCISDWVCANKSDCSKKVQCPICRIGIKLTKRSIPNYYTIDVV